MFCPLCHAEYREGFSRCADCQVDLIASLAGNPHEGGRPEESDEGKPTLLWRGQDPVIFTALVSALGEAQIAYHDNPIRDYKAYLGGAFPGALGFEVRVFQSDWEAAQHVLDSVLEQGSAEDGVSSAEGMAPASGEGSRAQIPEGRNPEEAISEIWSGKDPMLARFIVATLRENGVFLTGLESPAGTLCIRVRPQDQGRAREIIRGVLEGAPPA